MGRKSDTGISKDALQLNFCTAGDYGEHAVRLFKTIHNLYPKAKLHYNSIDCDKDQLNRMRRLGVSVVEIATSQVPKCLSGLDKAALCRAWRSVMLPAVLGSTGEPVVWFDSDSVLLKPLDDIIQKISKHDMALVSRPGRPPHKSLMSGVAFFNLYEDVGKFFHKWMTATSVAYADNRLRFFADQLALYQTVNAFLPNWLALDPKVYCSHWDNDPVIASWPSNMHDNLIWIDLINKSDSCLTAI